MKQITIVASDRPGLTTALTETLAARGINIETMAAKKIEGSAVFTLTVDRYDEALAALRDASFNAVSEDAFVIRLANRPGALARVARQFTDAGISLRSLRIIRRTEKAGLVSISTDDPGRARELVKDLLVE